MWSFALLASCLQSAVPVVGQLPLTYRDRHGQGPEKSCRTPQRAPALSLAQSLPGFPGYLNSCKEYGVHPSTDVMNRLDVGVMDIIILSRFGNLDMRALAMLLLDKNGYYLERVRSLDLSRADLDASSMLLVAQLLLHPSCKMETLDVSYQNVGLEGVCAVGSALRLSRSMRELRMHGCELYVQGGQVMLDVLRNSSLKTVDIQNNFIEFETCQAISIVAAEKDIDLNLDGNRVFDEVLNAVTHGTGVCLSIAGMTLMFIKVRSKPAYVKWSVAAFCVSSLLLYLASTLYHSFFALGRKTTEIFRTLDYSGIFLLIAGTYTPFFGILFHGERWAKYLLIGMWVTVLLGISIVAFYRGPFAAILRCALFLIMGWTCVTAVRPIWKALGNAGLALLAIGGLLYSFGVPFYLRGQHIGEMPDHSIWHLFVLSASTCHFMCIYWYVADAPAAETSEMRKMDEKLVDLEDSDDSD